MSLVGVALEKVWYIFKLRVSLITFKEFGNARRGSGTPNFALGEYTDVGFMLLTHNMSTSHGLKTFGTCMLTVLSCFVMRRDRHVGIDKFLLTCDVHLKIYGIR